MFVFIVCIGLCVLLFYWLNWFSCGVYLFGKFKVFKIMILIMVVSLYLGIDFYYVWRSIVNGLEVIVVEYNNLLFCLDELY